MMRSAFLLSSVLALTACSEAMPDMDGGPDSGSDAGRDSGPPPVDAGRRDAGPTSCTTGCTWVELALGSNNTCARRENGEVWCWGRGQEGQLGDNASRHMDDCSGGVGAPIDCSGIAVQVRRDLTDTFPALEDAVEISAQGAGSTCARRENGELWCWGPVGAVADTPVYRFAALRVENFGEITQASNGHHHTCMVRGAAGNIVCFGYGGSGDLGTGVKENIYTPTLMESVVDPTDTAIDFAGAVQVEASGYTGTTCARTIDRVYCWGENSSGQLGDGNISGHGMCGPAGNQYDCSPIPVIVGESGTPLTDVAAIAVGFGHTCVLGSGTEVGTVRCWGDNRAAQIGADPVAEGAINLPRAIAGIGTDVVEIDAGAGHTCVRRADGTVWCWGYNDFGQLGDGVDIVGGGTHGLTCTPEGMSGDCSPTPVQVMGIDDATVIATGASHSCAIRANNEIWCWGSNDNQQLGDGTRETRVAPVRANLPD